MNNINEVILKSLLNNDEYSKRVLPYIKEEYFETPAEKIIFKTTESYIHKFQSNPTKEVLYIEVEKQKGILGPVYNEIDKLIQKLSENQSEKPNIDWLISSTEKFCQKRALHNAIMEGISIFSGDNQKLNWEAIPDLMNKALSVSFDNSIGHDYINDANERYEFYHRKEEKLDFRLEILNNITKGGVARKTLNLFLAGTHVGKSLGMCNLAADHLAAGKNVLYITLEMAEMVVSQRIDANLFDIAMDQVVTMPKQFYMNSINKIKSKTQGKLKIKEYPMASAHVGHFKVLLNELRLKQNFIPDVIYVDYLNIMLSSRLKQASANNSYGYVKAISEELRGLASEFNVPIWSACQFNRSSAGAEDPGMEGISESFGVNFTADLILALIVTDELKKQNRILVKQLKNRYDDLNRLPKFFISLDRSKMKLNDVDLSEMKKNIDEVKIIENKKPEIDDKFKNFNFE